MRPGPFADSLVARIWGRFRLDRRLALDLARLRHTARWASPVWSSVDIATYGPPGARVFVERFLATFPPEVAMRLIQRLDRAERQLGRATPPPAGE